MCGFMRASDRATTAGVPGTPLGRPAPQVSRLCPLNPPIAALSATLRSPACLRAHAARPTTGLTERRRGDQAAAARSISVSLKACGHRAGVCVNGMGVQGPGEQAAAHVGEEHAHTRLTGAAGSPPRRGEKVDGKSGGRAHLRPARRRPSPGRSSTAWLAHRTDYESAEQPQRALPVGETLRGEEGRNGRQNEASAAPPLRALPQPAPPPAPVPVPAPPPCRRTPCTSTAAARAGRSCRRRKPCTRTGTGRASRSSRRRCRRANSPCIGSAGARARIASPCAHRFGELPALRRALQKTAPTRRGLSAQFGAHTWLAVVLQKSFFFVPGNRLLRFRAGPPPRFVSGFRWGHQDYSQTLCVGKRRFWPASLFPRSD
jgi:hypothetical protein